MIEVYCYDKTQKKKFVTVFWNKKDYERFVKKCENSIKIEIVKILDNSKYYD